MKSETETIDVGFLTDVPIFFWGQHMATAEKINLYGLLSVENCEELKDLI